MALILPIMKIMAIHPNNSYYQRPCWLGIRRAWLFIENVDRVPDMKEAEKQRLKAEAKVIIAMHYCDLFRHYGGVPIVDHAYTANEDMQKERGTVQGNA